MQKEPLDEALKKKMHELNVLQKTLEEMRENGVKGKNP